MNNAIKIVIKNIIPFKWIYNFLLKSHLLSKSTRPTVILNFIFQRIFNYNQEAKWSVHFTSRMVIPEKIKFGKNVEKSFLISSNCYYQAGNGIEIGDNTIWAPGVKFISANHDPDNLKKWKKDKPIKIGNNCWIGANAVILPGVKLGDNCIVGAGAVVTKSFSSGTVIVGNPAKEKKRG